MMTSRSGLLTWAHDFGPCRETSLLSLRTKSACQSFPLALFLSRAHNRAFACLESFCAHACCSYDNNHNFQVYGMCSLASFLSGILCISATHCRCHYHITAVRALYDGLVLALLLSPADAVGRFLVPPRQKPRKPTLRFPGHQKFKTGVIRSFGNVIAYASGFGEKWKSPGTIVDEPNVMYVDSIGSSLFV